MSPAVAVAVPAGKLTMNQPKNCHETPEKPAALFRSSTFLAPPLVNKQRNPYIRSNELPGWQAC